MIEKLDNNKLEIAEQIHSVFQVSYAVEAEILQVVDFPPLKRTVKDFLKSETDFFGFYKGSNLDSDLAAVMEVNTNKNQCHIQSLVVRPKYFRQGIAKQLLTFVFSSYQSKLFTVETGAANKPAVNLYLKMGFKEVKQWDTDHGVRKVRFEKNHY